MASLPLKKISGRDVPDFQRNLFQVQSEILLHMIGFAGKLVTPTKERSGHLRALISSSLFLIHTLCLILI